MQEQTRQNRHRERGNLAGTTYGNRNYSGQKLFQREYKNFTAKLTNKLLFFSPRNSENGILAMRPLYLMNIV